MKSMKASQASCGFYFGPSNEREGLDIRTAVVRVPLED